MQVYSGSLARFDSYCSFTVIQRADLILTAVWQWLREPNLHWKLRFPYKMKGIHPLHTENHAVAAARAISTGKPCCGCSQCHFVCHFPYKMKGIHPLHTENHAVAAARAIFTSKTRCGCSAGHFYRNRSLGGG